MQKMDNNALTQLKKLLDDGVINQDEYDKKAALFGIIPGTKDDRNASTEANINKGNGKGKTIAIAGLSILAAMLIVLSGYLYHQNQLLLSKVSDQEIKINKLTAKYNAEKSEAERRLEYENAIKMLYLDNAVLLIETDNTYYHRYHCPYLPTNYRYYISSPWNAEIIGYTECPKCFGYSTTEYCERYFE